MRPFKIISATRADQASFAATPLGRTLGAYPGYPLDVQVFARNSRGLPACYNEAIGEAAPEQILVFVHDDVHFADFFWMDHLAIGLKQFDIVGVAGNRRRVPRQPSWAFLDQNLTFDTGNLSGLVGHGKGFPCPVSVYGPAWQRCVLLDGVFLAARAGTLQTRQLLFDERFQFHFYDLDFCREAERKGLTMGTAAISLVHESVGGFDSPQWRSSYETYLAKWGE